MHRGLSHESATGAASVFSSIMTCRRQLSVCLSVCQPPPEQSCVIRYSTVHAYLECECEPEPKPEPGTSVHTEHGELCLYDVDM